MKETNIGKKVLVRGCESGLFFGILADREGQEVKLNKCRSLWYWRESNSILQIALDGVANPEDCRFTVTVDEIEVLDAVEIIPCTEKAIASIESVKIWKM